MVAIQLPNSSILLFKPGARQPVAGERLVFILASVHKCCVSVCAPPRPLITSGVIYSRPYMIG